MNYMLIEEVHILILCLLMHILHYIYKLWIKDHLDLHFNTSKIFSLIDQVAFSGKWLLLEKTVIQK